jgi:chromosome segregation ATPase
MVETRAAQAIGEANAARDEALAKLHDERAAREVFEAELEAQMAESLRAAREEEKSRYAKLESEKDTLLSALSDSSEMKRMYQERVKALEAEVKALKEKVGEGQVVS